MDQYYAAMGGRDGLRGECKSCFAERAARRYVAKSAEIKAQVKRWQKANPERRRAYQARYRAEHREQNRNGHLRRTFGLTLESYAELLEAQGGGCAICGRQAREGSSLHVDHDHASGEVRGLLCFSCNAAIGKMADDPDRLHRSADYVDSGGFVPGGVNELVAVARERTRALSTDGGAGRGN